MERRSSYKEKPLTHIQSKHPKSGPTSKRQPTPHPVPQSYQLTIPHKLKQSFRVICEVMSSGETHRPIYQSQVQFQLRTTLLRHQCFEFSVLRSAESISMTCLCPDRSFFPSGSSLDFNSNKPSSAPLFLLSHFFSLNQVIDTYLSTQVFPFLLF